MSKIEEDSFSSQPNSQETKKKKNLSGDGDENGSDVVRRVRPARACTLRAALKVYEVEEDCGSERKKSRKRKERSLCREESPDQSPPQDEQCSKIVTPLVAEPTLSQLPRWSIRSMWELGSVLNFLNVS